MSISIVNKTIEYTIRAGMAALVIAVFIVVVQNRDDTRDLKRDWPGLMEKVNKLEKQGEAFPTIFATKKEMKEEAQQIKNDLKADFSEQIKKGRIITNQNRQP